MTLNLYSVYDEKAQAYAAPFFIPNDGLAIRAFSEVVIDPKSAISRHPVDYTLYKLGTFDDCLGVVKGVTPVPLCKAVDFVKKASE